jgi:hypothetical protein
VLFSGQDLQVFTVGHEQKLADRLVEVEQRFWQYVETRTPPPVVTPQRVSYQTDAVEADGRIQTLVNEIIEYRAAFEDAKRIKESAEDELREALGDNTLVKGDGFTVTYRQGKDKQRVSWQEVARAYRHILADHPDVETIESVYTRTEPGNRPLLIKLERNDAPPTRIG